MSAHIAGGILCFVFGALLVVVGAVFYKPDKTSYSRAVHFVILVLGSLLVLGGSGWFWWAVS